MNEKSEYFLHFNNMPELIVHDFYIHTVSVRKTSCNYILCFKYKDFINFDLVRLL